MHISTVQKTAEHESDMKLTCKDLLLVTDDHVICDIIGKLLHTVHMIKVNGL